MNFYFKIFVKIIECFFFCRHYAFFKDHVIDKPKSYYSFDSGHTPDHWFEPVQVCSLHKESKNVPVRNNRSKRRRNVASLPRFVDTISAEWISQANLEQVRLFLWDRRSNLQRVAHVTEQSVLWSRPPLRWAAPATASYHQSSQYFWFGSCCCQIRGRRDLF